MRKRRRDSVRILWGTGSTATEKGYEMMFTASFFGEAGGDSPGCIAMHPGKIYPARFRQFSGGFVACFIP